MKCWDCNSPRPQTLPFRLKPRACIIGSSPWRPPKNDQRGRSSDVRFLHALCDAVAGSAANAEYFARVYGRNLCQHGFADLAYLDHLIRASGMDAGSRMLDLGCGSGMISEYFSDQTGAHVTGIDFIPKPIRDALARTKPKRDRLDFRVMDIPHLDFRAASFDVIVSVDTRYFTDPVATLRGCRPLLRDGGRLIAFFDQSCGPAC
jgi:2-polyprenyl-3-methyl-5-hydroxy-6-metoxy-1,4-benzoquinol methylase